MFIHQAPNDDVWKECVWAHDKLGAACIIVVLRIRVPIVELNMEYSLSDDVGSYDGNTDSRIFSACFLPSAKGGEMAWFAKPEYESWLILLHQLLTYARELVVTPKAKDRVHYIWRTKQCCTTAIPMCKIIILLAAFADLGLKTYIPYVVHGYIKENPCEKCEYVNT